MTTANRAETFFESGPFPHVQKSLGLFRPVGFNTSARATVSILIGWFPLVVLVLAEDLNGQISFLSFVTDFGVHARSLIAAPLLIICEAICLQRLEAVAIHFVRSGIIKERDRPIFKSLASSTRAMMKSTLVEIAAMVLTYTLVLMGVRYVTVLGVRPWFLARGNEVTMSWAGWWYALVSLPLLLMLFFGWLWRVILWSRFLIKVSRLKLSLIAAHPDRASGLKFLNSSLFAFMPVAFTFGVIAAGSAANRVAYQGMTLDAMEKTAGGLVVFVLLLFVGPLLVFTYKLQRQKVAGIFSYGALAENVGRQFEHKWLENYDKYSAGALEATDFSATTDLYGVVANVHEMKNVPFDLVGLVSLAVTTLLPFIPVLLMTMPIKQILQEAMKLLV